MALRALLCALPLVAACYQPVCQHAADWGPGGPAACVDCGPWTGPGGCPQLTPVTQTACLQRMTCSFASSQPNAGATWCSCALAAGCAQRAWVCQAASPSCPNERPNIGDACDATNALCFYDGFHSPVFAPDSGRDALDGLLCAQGTWQAVESYATGCTTTVCGHL